MVTQIPMFVWYSDTLFSHFILSILIQDCFEQDLNGPASGMTLTISNFRNRKVQFSDVTIFRGWNSDRYLIGTVGIWILNIWITNIWIMETYEKQTFLSPIFRSSLIQMPGSFYLPGKKIVDKLSTIQIIIRKTDHLIIGLILTIRKPV